MTKNPQRYCLPTMGRIRRIHFTGIGGAGMCGIAEVLLNQGYIISGSDLNKTKVTERLAELGVSIFYQHDAINIQDVDVVVKSTAIDDDNIELQAAHAARLPVVRRAEMLSEIMRFRYGIAIAGTHGKTTTTSLVTSILAEGGVDPTFVIGGKLNSVGTNAKLGESHYFVAEADESDASFLHLQPMIAVVTNIDHDHMMTYGDDFSKLSHTFVEFLHNLPFYGLAVLCIDCPVVQSILPQVARPMITYGLSEDADIYAKNWRQEGIHSHFTVVRKGMADLNVRFQLPGRHNVLNALAAIAIATELEVEDEFILAALKNFQGVGRRFQSYGKIDFKNAQVELIDDYGHHPREIKSTIDAVRAAYPNKRLVLAFQPHRYSRTQSLFDDFVKALSEVDVLLLLDIYSAGESPITGVSSKALCRNIRQRGFIDPIHVSREEDLALILDTIVSENDVVITQGAGDIGSKAVEISQR